MGYILIGLMCLGIWGCSEHNNGTTSIPSYPVHLVLDLRSEFPHFVREGGYQTLLFTEKRVVTDCIGFAGIVVSVAMDGEYHAHDLGCPHCVRKEQPVQIDGFFATCPVCGEQYDLSYGYAFPTKGISKEALRSYTTRYNPSSGHLTITP